jgi:hypothetical protein
MHFLILLTAWALAFFIVAIMFKPQIRLMVERPKYFALQLLIGIMLSTLLFFLFEQYLMYELMKFDLDGDQAFGGAEVSPEQEAAMERVTNGLARSLFALGALPLHFSLLMLLRCWSKRRMRKD